MKVQVLFIDTQQSESAARDCIAQAKKCLETARRLQFMLCQVNPMDLFLTGNRNREKREERQRYRRDADQYFRQAQDLADQTHRHLAEMVAADRRAVDLLSGTDRHYYRLGTSIIHAELDAQIRDLDWSLKERLDTNFSLLREWKIKEDCSLEDLVLASRRSEDAAWNYVRSVYLHRDRAAESALCIFEQAKNPQLHEEEDNGFGKKSWLKDNLRWALESAKMARRHIAEMVAADRRAVDLLSGTDRHYYQQGTDFIRAELEIAVANTPQEQIRELQIESQRYEKEARSCIDWVRTCRRRASEEALSAHCNSKDPCLHQEAEGHRAEVDYHLGEAEQSVRQAHRHIAKMAALDRQAVDLLSGDDRRYYEKGARMIQSGLDSALHYAKSTIKYLKPDRAPDKAKLTIKYLK